MTRSTLDMVREWHAAFDVPIEPAPVLPADRIQMRLAILEEEVAELRAAVEAGDMIETLDALCDIQYVLDGNFLEFGLHGVKQAGMEAVHTSNMSKLGADGRPVLRADGKVIKGPDFTPPDLASVLAAKPTT